MLRMSKGAAAVLAALVIAALAPPLTAAPSKVMEFGKVGFRLASDVPGDWAGSSIAVGDFDGDGELDLAVGAACDGTAGPGSGAIYILYGPITADRSLAEADAVLRGSTGTFFGEFLTTLDMDGDGADEIVVGAPGPVLGAGPLVEECYMALVVHPGSNAPGEAYVFRGGERMAGDLDATDAASTVISGYAPADFAGWDVGGADLDGDGRDELIVGAGNTAGIGAAFLYPGGELPASATAFDAQAHFLGELPQSGFGMGITSGDVDGDGIDDLLVSASSMLTGGSTYVFLGGTIPSGVIAAAAADIVFEGVPGDSAGMSLVVGDLDGDGVADIVVGAPGADMTYVFYGPIEQRGTVPLQEADVRVSGGQGRNAGSALAVVNLDGDDRSDLAIGAPWDSTVEDGGAVHRLVGPLTGDLDATTTGFKYVGEAQDVAGYALAVGDMTGNGYDDLVVGAPANAVYLLSHLTGTAIPKPGAVYVIPGGK